MASTPFSDLSTVLHDFKWSFDKVSWICRSCCRTAALLQHDQPCALFCCLQGDINHWVAVLDHFDSFFEQQVSQRNDVQLQAGDDPPFPKEACLAVLSTTCVLLENCSNKAAYNSSEVSDGIMHGLWYAYLVQSTAAAHHAFQS